MDERQIASGSQEYCSSQTVSWTISVRVEHGDLRLIVLAPPGVSARIEQKQ